MDYYICISFAISFGLVRILLFRSVMQSNGGISRFLNTFLLFWRLISYNFLYLDMDFLMHSLVYLVVIFLACIFSILATIASSFIHSFLSRSSFGGGVC